MCVRILLLFHETNQLTAGSRSPMLAGGTRRLSARQGLPATSGDGCVLRRSHPSAAAGSELL